MGIIGKTLAALEYGSRRLLIMGIRGYQYLLSPWLGNQCRFHPTCSQYALTAIERFGVLPGAWLALRRLLRCHPWHPGGFDPVPEQLGTTNNG